MVKKYNMDVKGIIHIGAHLGQEIEDYIGMGVQNIMLFEPLSETFELLTEKASKMNARNQGGRFVQAVVQFLNQRFILSIIPM